MYESHLGEPQHIQRLLDLGAIVPIDEDEEEEEELTDDIATLESAPAATLAEATFSESPPTLPYTQGLDTTEEEVSEAMAHGVGAVEPRSVEPRQGAFEEGASE